MQTPETNPAFSVVVPTHDRPRLLRRALASLRAQTHEDFEVRVVDDGSPEAAAVAAAISECGDDRFHLHRLDANHGTSAARNHGIGSARGTWITFLDDDDELFPEALRTIHDFLVRHSELDFTWAGIERTSADQSPATGVDWEPQNTNPLAHLGAGTGYALTVRRQLLQRLDGFDESLHAGVDFELLIRLGEHSLGRPIPERLVRVHLHQGSQLTDTTPEKARAFLAIAELHRDFLARHPVAARPFLLKAARLCSAVGQHRAVRRLLVRALRAHPVHPAVWKTIVALEIRRLVPWR